MSIEFQVGRFLSRGGSAQFYFDSGLCARVSKVPGAHISCPSHPMVVVEGGCFVTHAFVFVNLPQSIGFALQNTGSTEALSFGGVNRPHSPLLCVVCRFESSTIFVPIHSQANHDCGS